MLNPKYILKYKNCVVVTQRGPCLEKKQEKLCQIQNILTLLPLNQRIAQPVKEPDKNLNGKNNK